jgi:signal transduction histidine kinase
MEIERRRLFAVLDELPAFVYLEAPDHSVRFANRYFREHFGQYEGKKCYELLKRQKQPCKICPTARVFETGKPQDWESSEMGDGRTYQIYDYPFSDIDGTQLILELGIDITKRKQAESEMRRLSSQILNAQEDERRRIAFELHDQLGQDLSVLKLQIGSIKRNLQKDPKELAEMCRNTLRELDKTIEMVRRISRDLSPSILADLGLTSALRWLIRNFLKHSDIEISTAMEDIKDLFSSDQQIVIYRIIQEILTNIRKHAAATQVYVNIKKNEKRVRFSIEDNGIGFDIQQSAAQYAPEKGLGLAAMNERSKMIGGHFEISSQQGKGTHISFEIPIDDAP